MNKIFSHYSSEGRGWFRIFGRGLKWKDTNRYDLSFSQRYGHERYIKIGKWLVGYLPPLTFKK